MGYVYLICDPANDTFKIGVTKKLNIEERMHKMQTGNSTELFVRSFYECEFPFRLEKLLHNHFHAKRVHGEWFKLDASDIVSFKETCEKLNKIVYALKDNVFVKMT